MIGQHDNWIGLNKRFAWYSKFAAAIAALYGGLLNFPVDAWSHIPIFFFVLDWVHQSAGYVLPSCGAVFIFIEFFKKNYGSPQIWAIIHHILDEMHDQVFSADCHLAEHRVTLFKFTPNHFSFKKWPVFCDCLVPVERSHYLTRKSRAIFRVRDDGNAEGIVGQAYVQNACIYRESLPNIAPDAEPLNEIPPFNWKKCSCWKRAFYKRFWKRRYLFQRQLNSAKLYAKQTWTNESRVIRHKVAGKSMPRSMCGLPVEVGGKVWGVIVVDSRNEKLIGKEQIIAFYEKNAAVLSQLLQYSK